MSRFIPAGAGNTPERSNHVRSIAVHPRRRGEHMRQTWDWRRDFGSSPQARGTPLAVKSSRPNYRFIPAGAGNTRSVCGRTDGRPVHPRRRGEHRHGAWIGFLSVGSSPQARGTPTIFSGPLITPRFIPAGAGNTIADVARAQYGAVHPRRRGEHARRPDSGFRVFGSSPQARGTHQPRNSCGAKCRFIPAGAGNTDHQREPHR